MNYCYRGGWGDYWWLYWKGAGKVRDCCDCKMIRRSVRNPVEMGRKGSEMPSEMDREIKLLN